MTLDDGKGAIPISPIMRPNKTETIASMISQFPTTWGLTDRCPKIERMQKFNAKRYLGTWYQAYRDKRDPFQQG